MKIHSTDISMEIEGGHYLSTIYLPVSSGRDAGKAFAEEACHAMCGEFYVAERTLKDHPELLQEFRAALKRTAELRKEITSLMRPILRKTEKAVRATTKAIDEKKAKGRAA